ncbi:hypothetical protein DPMN_097631 [Dreissena polymorpha]|uniref:Uncharacterized protein n=1 Tax=Dreissena polymorpha TaxID=45954 RepID=A0A9D4LDM8_DREPO|nr:hypothetical protein DPMN_097631 [Dreissena polymorpha]
MKQGGEWTDVSCGLALVLGTGFGEAHDFICQYNLTSKPINIFHELGTPFVGYFLGMKMVCQALGVTHSIHYSAQQN